MLQPPWLSSFGSKVALHVQAARIALFKVTGRPRRAV